MIWFGLWCERQVRSIVWDVFLNARQKISCMSPSYVRPSMTLRHASIDQPRSSDLQCKRDQMQRLRLEDHISLFDSYSATKGIDASLHRLMIFNIAWKSLWAIFNFSEHLLITSNALFTWKSIHSQTMISHCAANEQSNQDLGLMILPSYGTCTNGRMIWKKQKYPKRETLITHYKFNNIDSLAKRASIWQVIKMAQIAKTIYSQ